MLQCQTRVSDTRPETSLISRWEWQIGAGCPMGLSLLHIFLTKKSNGDVLLQASCILSMLYQIFYSHSSPSHAYAPLNKMWWAPSWFTDYNHPSDLTHGLQMIQQPKNKLMDIWFCPPAGNTLGLGEFETLLWAHRLLSTKWQAWWSLVKICIHYFGCVFRSAGWVSNIGACGHKLAMLQHC